MECSLDTECSLNGECNIVTGECHCDPGWISANCSILNLSPVGHPEELIAYSQPTTASWGGSVVFEKSTNTHHMFVGEMAGHCGMGTWGKNEAVVHAISTTGPMGPFLRHNLCLPAYSDNPQVVIAPDGIHWLLYHHARSTQGVDNITGPCFINNGTTRANASQATGSIPPVPKGFTMAPILHISNGPQGPWTGIKLNATGLRGDPRIQSMNQCNNPSPWVLKNGSIALLCKEGWCGPHAHACHTLFMADRYDGVYHNITSIDVGDEDPFLWINARGWHILFHNPLGPDGGIHAYSIDGFDWYGAWTRPSPMAYSAQVQLTNGSSCYFRERQRPKLLLDQDGYPTHLYTGIASGGHGSNNCDIPGHVVDNVRWPGGRYPPGHDYSCTSVQAILRNSSLIEIEK